MAILCKKIVDIGPALLEIFENISSVRFFLRHSVFFERYIRTLTYSILAYPRALHCAVIKRRFEPGLSLHVFCRERQKLFMSHRHAKLEDIFLYGTL